MAFYLLFLCGVLGGVFGGMGMGGGTALIPLLTIFLGVGQSAAQGINLLAFLPMSAIALSVHQKNGLVEKRGLLWFVVPALVLSAAGAFAAALLPSALLRKGFGAFLTVLSFLQLFRLAKEWKQGKNKKIFQ